MLGSAVAGLGVICILLARTFRQTRRLARSEQRNARELERLVAERTEALQSAQRALISESNFAMLGRMSAAINHEINQPLASLRFDLATLRHLVAQKTASLDEIHQTIIDSDRTTRRIVRVIETFRSLARQGAGELTSLDAGRLVTEVADTVRRERPAAAASLSVTVPAGPGPFVAGNVVLLQQAVLNLLHNAFDATLGKQGAHVTLALLDELGPRTSIDVIDNGPGVDPAVRERLFEPFASGANDVVGARSGAAGGLGLGLVLARQIAFDHDGTLEYLSCADGGSHFRLSLPVCVGPQNRDSDDVAHG